MSLTRTSLLLSLTFTMLALSAGSASAQIEVLAEPSGEHCPDVSVVGHTVSGGCHIEFASTVDVSMHAYIPGKFTAFVCEWYLEGRIDESGEGYFTEVIFEPPHQHSGTCTRVACDEVVAPGVHPMIPWPFHVREDAPGEEEMELEFCTRPVNSGEGTETASPCEVNLGFTEIATHQYEIGHLDAPGDPAEVFCENVAGVGYMGPHRLFPTPTSVEVHLVGTGLEGYELIH